MKFSPGTSKAFTLVELLTVIVIIMVLVGMVIGAAGLVAEKQRAASTAADIKALSLALEKFKQDNGEFPYSHAALEGTTSPAVDLDPQADFNPAAYTPAIVDMGEMLYNPYGNDGDVPKDPRDSYLRGFREGFIVYDSSDKLVDIVDPWGNSFGYSVARANEIAEGAAPSMGYNPTYDLWSTGGGTSQEDVGGWITNWD